MSQAVRDGEHGAANAPADPWWARGSRLGYLGAAALAVVVAMLTALAVAANGEFNYALDDAYIHLRMAENLTGGVLGINPGEFASASSSPIWSALLAMGVAIAGPKIGVPLVLAALAGVITMWGVDRWSRSVDLSPYERLGVMVGMLVVVPLPLMAMLGMEHVLQVATALLLVHLGVEVSNGRRGATLAWLAAAALLATSVRLEGAFVVLAIAVLMILRRRWDGLVALAAVAAPIVVVAAINVGQGWPVVPASVVAKSGLSESGIARFLPAPHGEQFVRAPRLVIATFLCGLTWYLAHRAVSRAQRQRSRAWSMAFFIVFFLHYCYAQFGWLYRYEAYLVALALFATALNVHDLVRAPLERRPSRVAWCAVAVLALIATVDGLGAYRNTLESTAAVHDQQLTMARFAAEACPGCRVVANDIGALAFAGDVEVTDAVGLADVRVLEAKRDGTYDSTALDRFATDDGAALAIVYAYPPWVPGVPLRWEPIGKWHYPDGFNAGGREVSFFSLDPARTDELRAAFDEFDPGKIVTVEPAD